MEAGVNGFLAATGTFQQMPGPFRDEVLLLSRLEGSPGLISFPSVQHHNSGSHFMWSVRMLLGYLDSAFKLNYSI